MKWTYLLLLLIMGCNSAMPELSSISGNVSGGNTPAIPAIPVKVSVAGLDTQPVKLTLNGESELIVSTDGLYSFPKGVEGNSEFEVSITDDPTDTNCLVENSRGEASGNFDVVRVNCYAGKLFLKGKVSGSFQGTLKLTAGGKNLDVQNNSNEYLFPPFATTPSIITIASQPSMNYCYFSNGLKTSTPDSPDIWCSPTSKEANDTINVTITVTGMVGDEVVKVGASETNALRTFTYSDKIQTYSIQKNKRAVFEIMEVPQNKRCYFTGTNSHYYSLAVNYNTGPEIVCETRTVCEYSGQELPSVNGKINDIACGAGKLFYGGKFNKVGRQLGITAIPVLGSVTSISLQYYDRIHGKINKIIPDGKNGFFAVGNFQRVGDKLRRNIVRLTSELLIDETFTIDTDGEILDALYKDNELYLFGKFNYLFQGGVDSFFRQGFAKINLSTVPEKISNLRIGNFTNPIGLSAKLIDWNLYIHATFNISGTNKSYLLKLNKNSGNLTTKETAATENGNTQFWKDSTGTVWMVNSELGLLNAETLQRHDFESAAPETLVKKNRLYTLTSRGVLYQASLSDILVVDLANLTATSSAQNFGKDSYPHPKRVFNAGIGFENGSQICFHQQPNTTKILFEGTTNPLEMRLGVACFGKDTQNITGVSLDSITTGTSAVAQGGRIYLNTQFYNPNTVSSLAVMSDSNYRSYISVPPFSNTDAEVMTLASDSQYMYIGGNFIASCGGSCSRLTRINLSNLATALSFDLSAWYPKIFPSGSITKLSSSSGYLYSVLEDSDNTLFAFKIDSIGSLLTYNGHSKITELLGHQDKFIYKEEGRYFFNTYIPNNPVSYTMSTNFFSDGAILLRKSDVIIAEQGSYLNSYSFDGSNTNNYLSLNFVPSDLKLATTTADYICYFSKLTKQQCYTLQGINKTTSSPVDDDYTLFKGIGNYVTLWKENSAPYVMVPQVQPVTGTSN